MSITVSFFLFRPLLDEDLVAFAVMMDDVTALYCSLSLSPPPLSALFRFAHFTHINLCLFKRTCGFLESKPT